MKNLHTIKKTYIVKNLYLYKLIVIKNYRNSEKCASPTATLPP